MSERLIPPLTHAMADGSHGLLAKAYYHLKPFIPVSMRWAIRRYRSPSILKRHTATWPINESAAAKPAGWSGWPDGKQFALVFTHDVESERGLRNVRHLAELEMHHGFRSSFNFIPEGSYDDPVETRRWLVSNGFEIGVHDLYHDGHLYESRDGFSEKARRINGYLADWQASGFRSGFMLRRLDWLHDLDILYDSSTFDTDPFEPQPAGSNTIFPFVVEPPAGVHVPGYVELSYTLPQDSTLFLLLRERKPQTWQRKLDWIARHGGLALVNIHPDYIHFTDKPASRDSYPVTRLIEFMEYIKLHYANVYWNPLARDLALWYKESRPAGSTANSQPTSRE